MQLQCGKKSGWFGQRSRNGPVAAIWRKIWQHSGCNTVSLHVETWESTDLSVQQLWSASGRWLHKHNHSLLLTDEYASLTASLDAADPSSAEEMVSDDHTQTSTATCRIHPQACTTCAGVMPPCRRGSLVRQLSDGLASSNSFQMWASLSNRYKAPWTRNSLDTPVRPGWSFPSQLMA